jgi:hypothetical protein
MSTEKLFTPPFRVSYPKVFKAELNSQNGRMEYSIVALFKKGEDISKLKAAANAVLVEKFGADKSKWPKNLKSPFRDQEDKMKDGKLPDGYEAGAIFLNLKSTQKPGLVDKDVQPITDQNEFYPGCWAHATVKAFYFGDKPEHKGNKGVAFSVNNIQKLRDDTPIASSKASAESDFGPADGGSAAAPESSDDIWG